MKGRTLAFKQITDSRFTPENKCLLLLREKIEKITELLNIEGIDLQVDEPYLLQFNEPENNIQYRANFYIQKNTRKITWSDIYKLVNSVKPAHYKFI